VTLEDETGTVNLVVHATTWQKYYDVARRSAAWVAFGKLETKHGVIHVVARRLEDFAQFLELTAADALQSKSRDFR
jgi:error-prone DNA polymerase